MTSPAAVPGGRCGLSGAAGCDSPGGGAGRGTYVKIKSLGGVNM